MGLITMNSGSICGSSCTSTSRRLEGDADEEPDRTICDRKKGYSIEGQKYQYEE